MLYSNFKQALKAGDVGEELASQMLTAIGYQVEDVSANRDYFDKDIDLIADGMTIEVKADSRMNETGNVCIETITNYASNKPGWFFYTQASHIFFVDVKQRIIHCVRLAELKELYNEKMSSLRHFRTQQMENGTYYKEAEIVLIPISLLETLEHYVKLEGGKIL